MSREVQFRLRIRSGDLIVIGPGKIALLEAIHSHGSISAAARALDMSYRRAWLLVDEMNRGLAAPVVDTAAGGYRGGSSTLTPNALQVIARYRAIEAIALKAAASEVSALLALVVN